MNQSDNSLVWRQTFTRVEMFIDGETGDFNGNNYQLADLVLRAFAEYVAPRLIKTIDVKKKVFTFFILVTVLRF